MLGFGIMGQSMLSSTPSIVEDITDVKITGAVFDALRADEIITNDFEIEDDWTMTTKLYARFNNNLYAGNAELGVDNVTNILIKRREVGEFEWFNMFDIPIEDINDFNFILLDRYGDGGQTYQYAFVPIINGLEGEYSFAVCETDGKEEVTCEFDGVIIMDKDNMYNTILDIETSTQKNHSKTYSSTLNNKYPVVIKNSMANYYTGSISATYLHFIGCDYDKNGSRKYREEFLDFLANDNPKIIKIYDGRTFLCEVVDQISDSNSDHHELHSINYNFVEIGDTESNKDMYDAGFLDITEEWW